MFKRKPRLVLTDQEEKLLEFIVSSTGVHPTTVLKNILTEGLSTWYRKIPRPKAPPMPPKINATSGGK